MRENLFIVADISLRDDANVEKKFTCAGSGIATANLNLTYKEQHSRHKGKQGRLIFNDNKIQ